MIPILKNKKVNIFLTNFLNLCVLNLLFLLFCLPLFTVGASLIAAFQLVDKIISENECNIVSEFLKAFLKNFKNGLIAGSLFVLSTISSVTGLFFTANQTGIWLFLQLLYFLILFYISMIIVYFFPIHSKFAYFSLKNSFRLSILISIKCFPYTLIIMLATFSPLYIMWVSSGIINYLIIMWMLLIGCSFNFYLLQKFFTKKIFKKYFF